MSRSFENVRMDVKVVSERWPKARRVLKTEDQVYGQKLAEMARKHPCFTNLKIIIFFITELELCYICGIMKPFRLILFVLIFSKEFLKISCQRLTFSKEILFCNCISRS